MSKLIIEVPDTIAAHVDAMPARERAALDHALRETTVAFATALNSASTLASTLSPANSADDSEFDEAAMDAPLSPEDIASIGRGIADSDAGRVVDGETVFARIRQRYNWA